MVSTPMPAFRLARPDKGHAIEEVVFQVRIDARTPFLEPEVTQTELSKLLVTDFPKSSLIRAFGGEIRPEGLTQKTNEIVGFSLEKFASDGAYETRLSGKNDLVEGVVSSSSITINMLNYDTWSSVWQKVLHWLLELSKATNLMKVRGVTLHYIDRLYCDECMEFPSIEVLNLEKSSYLPGKISTENDLFSWSSDLVSTSKHQQGVKEERLIASVEIDQENEVSRLTLSNPISIEFSDRPVLADFLEKQAEIVFTELKNYNSKILKDVLKPSVTELIGLDKGVDDGKP